MLSKKAAQKIYSSHEERESERAAKLLHADTQIFSSFFLVCRLFLLCITALNHYVHESACMYVMRRRWDAQRQPFGAAE